MSGHKQKRKSVRCPICAGKLMTGKQSEDGLSYKYCVNPACHWSGKPKVA